MHRFVRSNRRFLYDVIMLKLICVRDLEKANRFFIKDHLINKILNII